MIIKETNNREDIESILKHPIIFDCINDDNSCDIDNFTPPISDSYRYVGGYVKGVIIALMVYHDTEHETECHVQVLPEYRKEYALEFGEQSLNFRGTRPLIAEIPDLYRNVLAFAESQGFEVYDRKGDFVKNGVSYPINYLRYRG
jgi:hypothetical protein